MTLVRTLVVWCPDWPVAAAGHSADDRVAVVFANRVVACSAAARAEGVARGLRRRQAESRCSGLILVPDDPARDARAFEPVVAAVASLTPRVEVVRPGVCALATRGPSRYFGGDEALMARVVEAVADVDVACTTGVADGPFAAELAAQGGVCVPTGDTPAFLAPRPVEVLDRCLPVQATEARDATLAEGSLAPFGELCGLLVRLGIRTLGDLAALPAASVLARFGTEGAAAHRLARGLDERPLAAREPPPDLVVTAELDPPADRVDTAAFVAKALADELHERLAALGLTCARLAVEAETEHGESLSRLWRFDSTLSATALAERVRWQLDGWIQSGGTTAGFTLLRLVPDEVVPDEGRQLGFWGADRAADERAARALARVDGLLGPGSVVMPVLAGGRNPTDTFLCREKVVGQQKICKERDEAPWPGRIPAPSPATVYRAPLPADVVERRLSVDGGRWTDVSAWAGPWPVDERWWDPHAHRRRDRWQVVTADGSAHLLAHEHGRWWVEATYD